MCDKRRGWKTHVPFHTCLPLTAKRQIKGMRGGGGGHSKGGAAAFTSLKSYQSVFVKDFSGEHPTPTVNVSQNGGGFFSTWRIWRRLVATIRNKHCQ